MSTQAARACLSSLSFLLSLAQPFAFRPLPSSERLGLYIAQDQKKTKGLGPNNLAPILWPFLTGRNSDSESLKATDGREEPARHRKPER